MNNVAFDRLKDHRCALLDAATMSILASEMVDYYLKTKPYDIQINNRPWDRQQEIPEIAQALDIVARASLYDFVAVDRITLDSLHLKALPWQALIALTEVPTETYTRAGQEISRAVERLQKVGNYFWMTDTSWSDASQARHQDRLDIVEGPHGLDLPAWLSEPRQTLARVLFHFEVARQGTLPVFLSPTKQPWLGQVTQHLRPEVYELVVKNIPSADREQVKSLLDEAFSTALTFRAPALTVWITQLAEKQAVPPLDALLSLRAMEAAQAYRDALWEVQHTVLAQGQRGLAHARAGIQELSRTLPAWQRQVATNYAIEAPDCEATLVMLPAMGWTAQVLAADPAEIPTALLHGAPLYVTLNTIALHTT